MFFWQLKGLGAPRRFGDFIPPYSLMRLYDINKNIVNSIMDEEIEREIEKEFLRDRDIER